MDEGWTEAGSVHPDGPEARALRPDDVASVAIPDHDRLGRRNPKPRQSPPEEQGIGLGRAELPGGEGLPKERREPVPPEDLPNGRPVRGRGVCGHGEEVPAPEGPQGPLHPGEGLAPEPVGARPRARDLPDQGPSEVEQDSAHAATDCVHRAAMIPAPRRAWPGGKLGAVRAWPSAAACGLLCLVGLGQGCVLAIVGDGLEGRYIAGVPDVSQPPPNPLGFPSVDSWSGPLAAAAAVAFLATTVGGWPGGVTGNLPPEALSAYLGYFMATNGTGSPDRANAAQGLPGTTLEDLVAGIVEFARWDPVHRFRTPPPPPLNKAGFDAEVALIDGHDLNPIRYQVALGQGSPPLVAFRYWNPVDSGTTLWLTASGYRVPARFYTWGPEIRSSKESSLTGAGVPRETWAPDRRIGHVAVGVGYLVGDPDGTGPLPHTLWLLVRDTWAATAEHVAIPWREVLALVVLRPAR